MKPVPGGECARCVVINTAYMPVLVRNVHHVYVCNQHVEGRPQLWSGPGRSPEGGEGRKDAGALFPGFPLLSVGILRADNSDLGRQ